MCLQPIIHQSAHPEDLIQVWSQAVQPTRVQNLENEPHILQQAQQFSILHSLIMVKYGHYLVVQMTESVILLSEVDKLRRAEKCHEKAI